jgi:hypothetical protein
MIKKALFSLAIVYYVAPAFAQAPKYSNEFLAIGVGANALGMSNSVVATVNDVTSGYWNPAGLMGIKSNYQVALMHSEYFAGIAKYDYGAFAKRIDSSSAMAVSIIRFAVDDIPNTTQLINSNGQIDYNRITTFSAADYGFLFSYAKQFKVPGLVFGANAKVVRRIVGDFANSWGFGLDAGMQYKRGTWQFGAMARDITTTFNAWSYHLDDATKAVFIQTGNEIPSNTLELTLPKLILGVAKTVNYKKFAAQFQLNTDLSFDGMRNVLIRSDIVSIDPNLGMQLSYADIVFLRAGLGNIQEIKETGGLVEKTIQPNMGIGIKIKGISIDYALTNVGQQVGLLSNVFSLKFDINPKHDK